MIHRVLPWTRTDKTACSKVPEDGFVLGDLRMLLAQFDGFPDELEVDLRVAGKKVETDISLKVVDE